MELCKNDLAFINEWKESKFWKLTKKLLEEQKENIELGILSPIDEDKSKPKYNERDLLLLQRQFIEDFLTTPDKLKNLVINSDNMAEAETAE